MSDNKIKETNEDLLQTVAGGDEPEEFDWKTKGYVTPVKEQKKDDNSWTFEAIGDNTDKLAKIRK